MNNAPVAWITDAGTFNVRYTPWPTENGIPLYTHPVKEQSDLVNVVKDHIKYLEECVLILNDSMLVNTSNEMKVAIKELQDAIDTHLVKKLTDKITEQEKFIKAILKKGGCDGNICQKYNANPVKKLTDEEICKIFNEHTGLGIHQKEADKADLIVFARAILRKTQEK
ncbi:hypothetical protein UFOVP11_62 [uncultured Caudovirales phage]|uniref:Uncharacterized protein n=1 Tax=uncultured Caudovirales phage TaxID=2100421 RepID=A0A6J5KMM4_9CAUD|nr:hypothetical protein UFOVP11_62 [uncultured Caudovirales phage]